MRMRVRFTFVMCVVLGFTLVTPIVAKAALPQEVPVECQVYVDEREDYLLAVIGNYQEALAYEKTQVVYWQEAHDRVAANAVERNYEYAAEVEKNRKLRDRLRFWKELAQKLK
jgi:hypothetical protein